MAASLLPPNATETERHIEQATARLGEVPVPIRDLFSAERCPAALLPWLAWALSIDEWNGAWPETVKRNTIASSIRVHRRKGTVAAVRAALAALGVQVQLEEWWQTGGAPHTFKLHALINENIIPGSETLLTAEIYGALRRVVDATKPVRSHYEISVGVQFNQAFGLALPFNSYQVVRRCLEPEPPVGCIEAAAQFGLGLVSRGLDVVKRLAQPPAIAQTREIGLATAAVSRNLAYMRIHAEPIIPEP